MFSPVVISSWSNHAHIVPPTCGSFPTDAARPSVAATRDIPSQRTPARRSLVSTTTRQRLELRLQTTQVLISGLPIA